MLGTVWLLYHGIVCRVAGLDASTPCSPSWRAGLSSGFPNRVMMLGILTVMAVTDAPPRTREFNGSPSAPSFHMGRPLKWYVHSRDTSTQVVHSDRSTECLTSSDANLLSQAAASGEGECADQSLARWTGSPEEPPGPSNGRPLGGSEDRIALGSPQVLGAQGSVMESEDALPSLGRSMPTEACKLGDLRAPEPALLPLSVGNVGSFWCT